MSPQATQHDLKTCGIEMPLLIIGDVRILLSGGNNPVVFLIDENHGSNDCIDQNIANARELIKMADVKLIGVESHAGGQVWDIHEDKYTNRFDPGNDTDPVSNCSKFADEIRSTTTMVFGVESRSMSEAQQGDFCVGGGWEGGQAKNHPLNEKRSEHFLRTLFELRRIHNLAGNLILNAGGAHNSHIEGWINDGTIEDKAGRKAVYVRLSAPAYTLSTAS